MNEKSVFSYLDNCCSLHIVQSYLRYEL